MAKIVKKIEKPDITRISNAKELGEVVAWKRKELGLTRDMMAMQLNINARTLQGIEKGSGKQSLETVLTVLFELGIELEIQYS